MCYQFHSYPSGEERFGLLAAVGTEDRSEGYNIKILNGNVDLMIYDCKDKYFINKHHQILRKWDTFIRQSKLNKQDYKK